MTRGEAVLASEWHMAGEGESVMLSWFSPVVRSREKIRGVIMRRSYLVSAIILALASAPLFPAAAQSATPAAAEQATTQLPRNVRPTHYDVAITPHAEAMSFDGKVTVTVDVLQPTGSITLNAIDMTFSSVTLTPIKGKPLPAPKVSIDAENQTATFTFAKPIAKGEYRLAMSYAGKIGTQANGLFALDYVNKDGKKRALYTQFENSDARRFIPSWDEPNKKATFTLTATVPADQMAIANTPIAATESLAGGLKRVHFAPSPKMSSYLLFFGAGDFERVSRKVNGVDVGVILKRGDLDKAAFALDTAAQILPYYEDY